jgi:hypothetical protein
MGFELFNDENLPMHSYFSTLSSFQSYLPAKMAFGPYCQFSNTLTKMHTKGRSLIQITYIQMKPHDDMETLLSLKHYHE